MADMLVRLYDLPDLSDVVRRLADDGVAIRRAIAPEKNVIIDWVHENFSQNWAAEGDKAMANTPVSCFIALQGGAMLGFACYDATMRDFFGPMGVKEAARGRGLGKALLWACLRAMYDAGYAYAIIGGAGPEEFYRKTVKAEVIQGSAPGIYRGMLRPHGRGSA